MNLMKIFKGMPDAAQAIQKNFEDILAYLIKDSGWVDLVPKNGATGTVRVRKIWNFVFMEFLIKGVAAGSGGSNSVVQLPEGFRPNADFSDVVGTNSVDKMGMIRFSSTTGDISIWQSDLITATHSCFKIYIARGE